MTRLNTNQRQRRSTSCKSFLSGSIALTGFFFACHFSRAAEEAELLTVDYNPGFVHGSGIDISRFSAGNPVLPGKYNVTVWVNDQLRGKEPVQFVVPPKQSGAEACLTTGQLKRLGIRVTASDKSSEPAECAFIEQWVEQSSSYYNSGDFELRLRVPQINLVVLPRGYIDPDLWQTGNSVGFLDYSGNAWSLFQGARSTHSGNLHLATGINYAGWRLRHRMNSGWASGSSPESRSLYSYAAHDVTALKSELVLGETNTRGDLFESYGLRGVVLQSEERMLADSLRVYTPIIRGIAETNARVTVTQRGLTIYETVVPPGPFELNDVGTMGYGGDLLLTVTEADGRQRRQSIPFSAPPMLLHQGVTNFSLSAGQLKDRSAGEHPVIAQGVLRYGLFNTWTLYGGGQMSEKYQSLAAGSAFNTLLGGLSFDVTHAQSELWQGRQVSGNSYQVNFSKYLSNTDTNLMLAAYRYSDRGFYTFREASMTRLDREGGRKGSDFRTRQRFTASVSQRIQDNMSLYFSGSYYTYWDARSGSRQYSVNFSHSLPRFSYGLTAMRTRNERRNEENSILLSVSVPLGNQVMYSKPAFSSLYTTMSHSSTGNTQFQTLANGSQGDQNELTYGVGATGSNSRPGRRYRAVSGNINYRTGVGQFGGTALVNNDNAQQLSFSAAGSLVGHRGGVTAGPALGNAPFAIISADGAQGARLLNGYGSKIDGNGYAIMPSLTPYRENLVTLDPRGLPDTVDVLESEKIIVPRQGAAIAVTMKTITGTPMVLTLRDKQQQFLPIGTDLQTEEGGSQAVVGQGGQAFIRGWQAEQPLYALVGEDKLQCMPQTSAVPARERQIMHMEVVCSRTGD